MIKQLLFISIFVGAGFTANSQVLISIIFGDKLNSDGLEFGLDGGVNFSQISGMESKSMATNLHLGFYFDIRLKNQWNLNTGVLVKSSQGTGKLTEQDTYTMYPELTEFIDSVGAYSQGLGYFNVPIMLKYKFKNHFFLEAGTQAALLINAHLSYAHKYENVELNTSVDNRDSFNRIDFGLLGGLGYKLGQGNGLNIGVKYYYGLVDITKTSSLHNTNRVIYVKVDIPIGRKKAARKAAESEAQN